MYVYLKQTAGLPGSPSRTNLKCEVFSESSVKGDELLHSHTPNTFFYCASKGVYGSCVMAENESLVDDAEYQGSLNFVVNYFYAMAI